MFYLMIRGSFLEIKFSHQKLVTLIIRTLAADGFTVLLKIQKLLANFRLVRLEPLVETQTAKGLDAGELGRMTALRSSYLASVIHGINCV
jgi:hypothetical protein